MALSDQIVNQIPLQAVVTHQESVSDRAVPLRITFFNEDGTPFNFGEGAGSTVEVDSDVFPFEAGSSRNYVAWSFDPANGAGSAGILTSGTMHGARVWLPKKSSVTGIIANIGVGGAGLVAGQSFAALYDINGVLIDVVGDQSTAWATTGYKFMNLAGDAKILEAGFYDVVFWSVGTTPPRFHGGYQSPAANMGMTSANSRFFTADTGLTTTAPTQRAGRAPSSVVLFAGLQGTKV